MDSQPSTQVDSHTYVVEDSGFVEDSADLSRPRHLTSIALSSLGIVLVLGWLTAHLAPARHGISGPQAAQVGGADPKPMTHPYSQVVWNEQHRAAMAKLTPSSTGRVIIRGKNSHVYHWVKSCPALKRNNTALHTPDFQITRAQAEARNTWACVFCAEAIARQRSDQAGLETLCDHCND